MSRTDRCLPAHRDYCEAAAWSVIVIINDVWRSKFSFIFLGFFLSPVEGREFFQRESEERGLTDELYSNTPTLSASFLCWGAPSPLTLMIV